MHAKLLPAPCSAPQERITIFSTYWYVDGQPFSLRTAASTALLASGGVGGGTNSSGAAGSGALKGAGGSCDAIRTELDALRGRFNWQAEELQRVRHKCLPG